MRKLILVSASFLALAISSNVASAQSIDYGTFAEMFGEPVTTSGNGSPQRLSEVPLNMEIITQEEIVKSGARNIPELLRFVPGVSVRQITVGQYEVAIRGYNQASSERVLVLVNGRQVYSDAFGQVVWSNIPVEMSEIKQIEVVKGPNTALFGFNAVSGVVNIITINPLFDDKKELKTTLSIGRESLAQTSGVFTAAKGDVAVKVAVGASESDEEFDEFVALNSADTNVYDTKRESVSVDTRVKFSNDVEAQFEASKNDGVSNTYIAMRNSGKLDARTDSVRGRIMADTKIGSVDFDAYFTQSKMNYYSAFDNDNHSLVVKLNDTFKYGTDHIFRIGTEYRTATNIYEPLDQTELEDEILSFNGLWDWKVNDKLRTSAAARFDHFSLKALGDPYAITNEADNLMGIDASDLNQVRDEYSINLGAVYQLSDIETLRASFARGADLPSFTEFLFQISTANGVVQWAANPEVDTSIVSNIELGYDRKIKEIDGLFRGSIFYQESNEMQGFGNSIIRDATGTNPFTGGAATGGTSFIAVTGNLGDSKMYGIELGLEGKYDENWDWTANYAFVKVKDDLRNFGAMFPYIGLAAYHSAMEYENSNAEHTVNLTATYSAEKWDTTVGVQYTSGYQDLIMNTALPHTFTVVDVDASVVLNASFNYKINDNVTVTAAGQNLLSSDQSVYNEAEPMVWTSLTVNF